MSAPTPSQDGFIERFEAFARSKPADETYRPTSSRICAFTQFCATESIDKGEAAKRFWKLPCDLQVAILGVPTIEDGSDNAVETFGALADRLAALRESGK